MHTIYLFPHKAAKVGWLLLIPGLVLGILVMYFDFEIPFLQMHFRSNPSLFEAADENFTNELAGLLLMAGLMLIAFSRRKQEDELIAQLRLDALLWAVYANSLVLVLCLLLVYGTGFFSVLVYNMYTVPVIFLLRFQYLLRKASTLNAAAE